GLDCGTCARKAAASVARICTGLESHGLQQLFLELYPSIGCRPMAASFELAYHESTGLLTAARASAAAAA
ncbi:MAG TPA: hypothetical protein VGV35_07990, partial [Bryobacteraceae bacterium]|nr:hypothetical protein [Bryobacteraceae bacterium]